MTEILRLGTRVNVYFGVYMRVLHANNDNDIQHEAQKKKASIQISSRRYLIS